MSEVTVRAEGLGKRYRIGALQPGYGSLRESLVRAGSRLLRRTGGGSAAEPDGDRRRQTLWALRDVSFSLRRGEVVGIVGRNGAGKSTLLKLLARITRPTEGWAEVRGRVGSLLEVGTGFHPELTGRENVYLSGAVLGMSRRETQRRFDEIVAFAEIDEFLDTPVKRYSSGMYVRLAFAVAAHLDPEILIVDEVLAVGDAAFQRRCLDQIAGAAREGRTVFFVSHNMHAVATLCSTAMWLEGGRVRSVGPAAEQTAAYLGESLRSSADVGEARSRADSPVILRDVRVVDGQGRSVQHVDRGEPFDLEVEYVQRRLSEPVRFIFKLSSAVDGGTVLTTSDRDRGEPTAPLEEGAFVLRCRIPAELLNRGAYSVHVHVDEPGRRVLHVLPAVCAFSVVGAPPEGSEVLGRRDGCLSPFREWSLTRLDDIGEESE